MNELLRNKIGCDLYVMELREKHALGHIPEQNFADGIKSAAISIGYSAETAEEFASDMVREATN